MVKCEWNTLVVASGKVGYLTGIVRFHINSKYPKPAYTTGAPNTTTYGKGGSTGLASVPPIFIHFIYVTRS